MFLYCHDAWIKNLLKIIDLCNAMISFCWYIDTRLQILFQIEKLIAIFMDDITKIKSILFSFIPFHLNTSENQNAPVNIIFQSNFLYFYCITM